MNEDSFGGFYKKNGVGPAQEDWKTSAMECFKKAAVLGIPRDIRDLGLSFENGKGVPQDWTNAVLEWYQKYYLGNGVYQKVEASEDPIALVSLGMSYGNAYGAQKDLKKAFELYFIAATADWNFVGMECLA